MQQSVVCVDRKEGAVGRRGGAKSVHGGGSGSRSGAGQGLSAL